MHLFPLTEIHLTMNWQDGWTALFLDIVYSEGNYETVHSLQNMYLFPLIEIYLTLNWQDGGTALMYAAQNGHSNVVETLLQHEASVDMQSVVSTL